MQPCVAASFCMRNHSSLWRRRLESDAEIRCRKYHTLSKSPARVPSCVDDASCLGCLHGAGTTQVRQWRRKRVLMRPEAAFPYVFAAEGAQHPPKKPPRSAPPPPRPTPPAHPQPTSHPTLRHTSPAHTPPPRLRQECNHSALSAFRIAVFREFWWGGVAFFSLLYSRGVVPVLERK